MRGVYPAGGVRVGAAGRHSMIGHLSFARRVHEQPDHRPHAYADVGPAGAYPFPLTSLFLIW